MKTKILYITGAILLLLAVTNPSPKDFYYYSKGKGTGDKTHRGANLLICSFYSTNYNYYYLGILGNYIMVEEGWIPAPPPRSRFTY